MPAQRRPADFWRWIAVRLAVLEVEQIKRDLGLCLMGWHDPISPEQLADAQEQWEAVMASGRANK